MSEALFDASQPLGEPNLACAPTSGLDDSLQPVEASSLPALLRAAALEEHSRPDGRSF